MPALLGSLQSNLVGGMGEDFDVLRAAHRAGRMGVTSISAPMTVCYLKFPVALILYTLNYLYLVIVKFM
jgi:hypothetical protein